MKIEDEHDCKKIQRGNHHHRNKESNIPMDNTSASELEYREQYLRKQERDGLN